MERRGAARRSRYARPRSRGRATDRLSNSNSTDTEHIMRFPIFHLPETKSIRVTHNQGFITADLFMKLFGNLTFPRCLPMSNGCVLSFDSMYRIKGSSHRINKVFWQQLFNNFQFT